MKKITESPGNYRHLEKMDTPTLLAAINAEDRSVALAVQKVLPEIEALVDAVTEKLEAGGRLFYLGAGTSGRLGVLDASEIPPTYGVSPDLVVGLIAGGDHALRNAVEGAEDSTTQGWLDLADHQLDNNDIVVGLAASGTTPYVVSALATCQEKGILTGCICCNPDSPLAAVSDFPVEVVVGPEIVTGSTRMKSGTAQKLVLNMLSSVAMIKLGRVVDNRMVDMQLSNDKLIDRGSKMVVKATQLNYAQAREMLLRYGSVRAAIAAFREKA